MGLDLARQLASKLEPQFRVILTRSDDYAVDLHQRAATANQSKADLMISIHTGSGFLHRREGIGIYYYAPLKNKGATPSNPDQPLGGRDWDKAQLRHRTASMALANSLITHLRAADAGERVVQGAPLKILEGVNLPAVLVEVGHITRPATEMDLSKPKAIDRLSTDLAKGIRNYVTASTNDGRQ